MNGGPRGQTVAQPLAMHYSGDRNRADRDLAGARIGARVERHLLALMQRADAGPLQGGRMDEHVLAAVVRLDEAEALLTIVELHCSGIHVMCLSLTVLSMGSG